MTGRVGTTEKARYPNISKAHYSHAYEKSTRRVESRLR